MNVKEAFGVSTQEEQGMQGAASSLKIYGQSSTKKVCTRCKSTFSRLKDYYRHMERCLLSAAVSKMATRMQLSCRKCGQQFRFFNNYRKHIVICWQKNKKSDTNMFIQKEVQSTNSTSENSNDGLLSSQDPSAKKRFSCPRCKRVFKNSSSYRAHVRNMKTLCRLPPYTCQKCFHVFPTANNLIRHEHRKSACVQTTPDPKDPYMCGKCGRTFHYHSRYKRHMLRKSDCNVTARECESVEETTGMIFRCACGKIFHYWSLLARHLNRKNPCMDLPPKPKMLTSSSEHVPDNRQGSNDPEHISSLMGHNAEQQESFLSSKTSGTQNLPVRRFGSIREKIIKKYQIITNKSASKKKPKDPFYCDICNKNFANSFTYIRHTKDMHGILLEKNIKCSKCPRKFVNKKHLLIHQREANHHDHYGPRFRECYCPFCNKKFMYLGSRNNHIKIHSASYPKECKDFLKSTTCDMCRTLFATPEEKTAHVASSHAPKVANSEKTSRQLKENSKDNSNDKSNIFQRMKNTDAPHKCHICRKVFCSPFIRDRHMVTNHTKLKPFQCDFCDNKFQRSEALNQHLQQYHSQKLRFMCRKCGAKFRTRLQVTHHISRSHIGYNKMSLIHESHGIPEVAGAEGSPNSGTFRNEELPPVRQPLKSQELYVCKVCNDATFTKLSSLTRHYKHSKMHRENARRKRVLEEKPQQTHEIKVLEQPDARVKYHCNVCSIDFSSISSFVPHRLSHFHLQNVNPTDISESNPYSCEICSMVFGHHQKVQTHLLWHLREDNAGNQLKQSCQTTSKNVAAFQSSSRSGPSLEDRFSLGFNQKLPMEAVAKKSLVSSSKESRKLLQIESFPKPKISNGDGLVTFGDNSYSPTSNIVNSSNKMRLRWRKLVCCCKKTFPNKKALRVHMRRCTVRKYKSLRCSHCNLVFRCSSDLHYHERSCMKVCGTEEDHINGSGENCFSVISEKLDLADGGLKNLDEKQTFPKSGTELEVSDSQPEMVLFSKFKGVLFDCLGSNENKQFQCLHCNQNFLQLFDLKEHCVMHYPFECSLCKNSIGTMSELKDHEQCLVGSNLSPNCGTIIDVQDPSSIPPSSSNEERAEKQLTDSDASPTINLAPSVHIATNSEEAETLSSLRKNFSHLLFLLVADPELMAKLGWGERLIDSVLEDVLSHMGVEQQCSASESSTDLERLRKNISLLLQVCIKDQVMDAVASKAECVDKVVKELLSQCCDKLALQNGVE